MQSESKKKKIIVLIPLGVPGMGKTTLLSTIKDFTKKNGWSLSMVSNDDIREDIMKKLKTENPNMDSEKIFEMSTRPTRDRFNDDLTKVILDTKNHDTPCHLVFLDKNHPPTGTNLQNVIKFLNDSKFQQYDMKKYFLSPMCPKGFVNGSDKYPYSLNLLLTCLKRATGRKEHPTLVGENSKVAGVVLGFFNFYKNFNGDDQALKSIGADGVLKIPFTHEDELSEKGISKEIVEILGKILGETQGFQVNPNDLDKLLELIVSNQWEPKNPDPQYVSDSATKGLEECFSSF